MESVDQSFWEHPNNLIFPIVPRHELSSTSVVLLLVLATTVSHIQHNEAAHFEVGFFSMHLIHLSCLRHPY